MYFQRKREVQMERKQKKICERKNIYPIKMNIKIQEIDYIGRC